MLRELAASIMLFVSGFHGPEEKTENAYPQPSVQRVVAIALDGIREKDILPAMTVVTQKMQGLAYQVHWYGKAQDCRVSQPHNISLPAYASIFTGKYDHRIRGNLWYGRMKYLTLFDRFARAQLFSSWMPIKNVMSGARATRAFANIIEKGIGQDEAVSQLFLKGYNGSQFAFVHFVDADDFAHMKMRDAYNILVEREAYRVLEIMEHVNKRNGRDTLFVIMSDHGRGTGDLWHSHGPGIPGSENMWVMVVSPVLLDNPLPVCNHHGIHDMIVETLK